MARVPWANLPADVRNWVAAELASPVVTARSQPGGFSPGAACRLTLADGRRAFLKAVSSAANPASPGIHRREATVTAALPPQVPVPRFRAIFDDGQWVALLFDDIDGREPEQPWRCDELERVLAAIDRMHELLTPTPVIANLRTVAQEHADAFGGWRDLASAATTPAGLDDWSRRNLDRLAGLESGWQRAAAGETLLHSDIRADNILISTDQVWFVDWPWACVGAAWFDVLAMVPSVVMQGGPAPEWVLARSRTAALADRDAINTVLAALAGYFTRQALLPPPPGIPTVREFQAVQGDHARAWLRERTGWT